MQVFLGVNSIPYIHVSHSTCVCHSECTVVLQPPYYVSRKAKSLLTLFASRQAKCTQLKIAVQFRVCVQCI